MKKQEIKEKLNLNETQYKLLATTSIRGLQILGSQLDNMEKDGQENKLPYTREDIDVLVKMFGYDFEWSWEIE